MITEYLGEKGEGGEVMEREEEWLKGGGGKRED